MFAPNIREGGLLPIVFTPCAFPVVLENSGSVHSFVLGNHIKRFLPLNETLAPFTILELENVF